ncbi:hypothetical protein ACM34P_004174 [Cronobacter sakazakii]|uniref:hypothetical protein n=1 Tax=Cronobacter sakazakii TaxID=28141 RepID=UPI000A108546|nr:hypothetical protein [Cronobacter sakazakii]ELY2771011.1 hypothetical protein [Cronobacter sakazakii]KAB0860127.1 hypothetical protein FZI13_00890 [Cronobacter sakazakii]MBF4825138.1 hypothetical protein [Cronobacter sakazakii]HDK7352960.1 hypothetical protein [Cronobacter sakazakii]
MNNDELIAAGHELAKCLDSSTPLLDIAKMIVRLADKLDVTTLSLREKTKQCEQLAAERDAVVAKEQEPVAYIIQDAEMRSRGNPGFLSYDGTISNEDINEYEISITPLYIYPATDAFLREVKAQAITSALDSLDGVFDTDCVMEANGVSYEEAEQRTTGALAVNSALIEFAAQLRKGGAA